MFPLCCWSWTTVVTIKNKEFLPKSDRRIYLTTRKEILTMSILNFFDFHVFDHCPSSVSLRAGWELLNSHNSAHSWELSLLEQFLTDSSSFTSWNCHQKFAYTTSLIIRTLAVTPLLFHPKDEFIRRCPGTCAVLQRCPQKLYSHIEESHTHPTARRF